MMRFGDNPMSPLIDMAMMFGKDVKLIFIKETKLFSEGDIVIGRYVTGSNYVIDVPNKSPPSTVMHDDEYVIPLAKYREQKIDEILNG